MTDINESLAKAMGYIRPDDQPYLYWRESDDSNMLVEYFDYRDTASVVENLKWLLNNGFGVPEKVSDDYEIYRRKGGKIVRRIVNAEFEAAVAYARIEANKDG